MKNIVRLKLVYQDKQDALENDADLAVDVAIGEALTERSTNGEKIFEKLVYLVRN